MNDQQFYVFDSVGMAIARGAVEAETVCRANSVIDQSLGSKPADKFSILELDPLFFDLMAHPWVMKACARILGAHFRFDHAFGLEQPTAATNLHGGPGACQSSCFYHGSAGAESNVRVGRLSVGVALTEQSPATGGLAYVPGSHKSSSVKPGARVLAEVFGGDFANEAVVVPRLGPGDVCVFADCLVHGASPWRAAHTRRALYYMYSPGYMAWRPYAEIEKHAASARTPLQRRLLRPPYVASFGEEGGKVGDNRWREPTP